MWRRVRYTKRTIRALSRLIWESFSLKLDVLSFFSPPKGQNPAMDWVIRGQRQYTACNWYYATSATTLWFKSHCLQLLQCDFRWYQHFWQGYERYIYQRVSSIYAYPNAKRQSPIFAPLKQNISLLLFTNHAIIMQNSLNYNNITKISNLIIYFAAGVPCQSKNSPPIYITAH